MVFHHKPTTSDHLWTDEPRHCCDNPATFINILGVIMDQDFTISSHIGKLVSTCFYSLRQIKIICWSLTTDAAKTLVNSLVTFWLDLCNLVLASKSAYCLRQVQSVLSGAECIVTRTRKYDHITALHWLPVPQYVDYVCMYVCVYLEFDICLHGAIPASYEWMRWKKYVFNCFLKEHELMVAGSSCRILSRRLFHTDGVA